jgi:hypothetical protein
MQRSRGDQEDVRRGRTDEALISPLCVGEVRLRKEAWKLRRNANLEAEIESE